MKKLVPVYAILAVAIATAFLAGYYVKGYYASIEMDNYVRNLDALRKENIELREKLSRANEELTSLRSENMELKGKLESLESEISSLTAEVDEKSREVEKLKIVIDESNKSLSTLQNEVKKLKDSLAILRDDKKLLIIISSKIPDDRKGAEQFWRDARELVERVDPSLVQIVDRILYYIDDYFDWYESLSENATEQEVCEWIFSYYESWGAQQYDSLVSKFKSEVYNLIISHINEILVEMKEIP